MFMNYLENLLEPDFWISTSETMAVWYG